MHQQAQMGIAEALIERFEKNRLPRILKIKDRVDQGQTLDATDFGFLERVLNDAQVNQNLIDAMPHCRDLFAKVVHLYRDITARALQNEECGPAS
jgi:hypothetical protein